MRIYQTRAYGKEARGPARGRKTSSRKLELSSHSRYELGKCVCSCRSYGTERPERNDYRRRNLDKVFRAVLVLHRGEKGCRRQTSRRRAEIAAPLHVRLNGKIIIVGNLQFRAREMRWEKSKSTASSSSSRNGSAVRS